MTQPVHTQHRYRQRVPLMLLAALALLAGLWAGLIRLGWQLPPLALRLPAQHGPLMVSGFLGTLISLERAVALSQNRGGRRIYYLAPLLAGLGALALFTALPPTVPRGLSTLGALGLVRTTVCGAPESMTTQPVAPEPARPSQSPSRVL